MELNFNALFSATGNFSLPKPQQALPLDNRTIQNFVKDYVDDYVGRLSQATWLSYFSAIVSFFFDYTAHFHIIALKQ